MLGKLDRAMLTALAQVWTGENQARFRGAMRAPVFTLTGEGKVAGPNLGMWSADRCLSLDRWLAYTQPWPAVVEVMLHEMAHQYVAEVLRVRDETAHGPAFLTTCKRFGIDPAASGVPSAGPAADDRVMERVRRLFALAQSSNQFEAEAAMNQAQTLLLKYNLTEAHTAERPIIWRTLGEPRTRFAEDEKVLAALIGQYFFVKVLLVGAWIPRQMQWGKVIEISGTRENIEMAEYVYDFLLATTERLWVKDGVGHTRTALAKFRAGAYRAFYTKLAEQKRQQSETGLVWSGDPRVEAWFQQRHPRVRTGRSSGFTRDADYAQGQAAGRDLVLHRPITGTQSRGRLLE